jgi:PAS domain S-box-containing protein
MTNKSLRVLMVEDSKDDEFLITRELKKGGYDPVYERIETASAMKKALHDKQWDIILCDYKMPQFDAPSAIALLKEANIDIPLIIVSGTIGEDVAVECMRLGAQDYIMKGKLSRLCPAIAREREEAKVRNNQKQAEDAKRESEKKYRDLYDFLPIPVFEMDFKSNITSANRAIYEMFGGAEKDLEKGFKGWQLLTNDAIDKSSNNIQRLLKGEKVISTEYSLKKLDGTEFPAIVISSLIYAHDKPVGVRGAIVDITELKRSEELLKQNEEKYRLLADHMKDQVWLMDLDLKWTYISPSMEKLLGYNLGELIQLPLDKLLTATSLKKAMEHFSIQLSKALPISPPSSLKRLVELEFICKNGQTLWGECSFSFIRDENGKPLSILGEGKDITERRQAEEKLLYEEHRFRTLAEQSSDIIVIVNREGIITYENQAIERALGFKAEERIGSNLFDLIHTDDLNLLVDAYEKLANDKNASAQQYEVRLHHKDGSWRTFEVAGSNLVNDTVIEGVIINLHDVTERKQAEAKLKQTLESLKKAVGTTIQVLVSALESRDPYTAGHQSRVAHLACAIGTEMGLDQDTIDGIRMAGVVHDIGKLSIPAEILTKPSKLTDIEFLLIKQHSQTGYEMLKDVESPWPLAQIVYQHHERINGSGYPHNLKGDEIILEARIMAVADVVEAMASHRPYRASLGIGAALEEINKNKGILYDEVVADTCLKLFTEKSYKLP